MCTINHRGMILTMATKNIAVRLPVELIERIDAMVPLFSTSWRLALRSDVLRAAIMLGVERLEAGELPGAGTPPTPT